MYTVSGGTRGRAQLLGVEEHRASFSNEVMLELGLERWIGSVGALKQAARGEKKGIPRRIERRCDFCWGV